MTKRIAVVGGGYSGLITAYLLQKKGYDVTVFEKEERLGGQCYTIYNKNEFCELGSVLGTSEALMNFMKEIGVETEYKYFHRNFINRFGKRRSQINPNDIEAFQQQYKRLPKLLEKYNSVLRSTGWNDIPIELTQSFESWCITNKLEKLIPVYAPHIVAFGYGKTSEISAIYALKHLDLWTLSSMVEAGKLISFTNGAQEIVNMLARNLEDVRLATSVIKIKPNRGVTIETTFYSEHFDQVVITAPLENSVIQSHEHASCMSRYQMNPYNVLIYVASEPYYTTTYFSENFNQDKRLLLLHSSKAPKSGRLLTAYAYGNVTMNVLKENIDEDLKLAGFKVDQLFAYKQWKTFPHVTSADIADGFYEKVNALQGKHGIYFAGGLTCFSTLDKLTLFTIDFVDRYF